MKYVPQEITTLNQSSLSNEWSDWSPTATYNTEDSAQEGGLTDTSVVYYGNYYYRTITDNNVGYNPEEYLGVKWIRWSVSNKFGMLDLRSTTKSVQTGWSDWSSTTTYNTEPLNQAGGLTDVSVVWYVDKFYRSLTDNNLNNDPVSTLGVNWEEWNGNIVMQFPKNFIDMIAIGYYTASFVTVENLTVTYDVDGVTVLSEVVEYLQTIEQSVNELVEDYYTYFYEPYSIAVDRSKVFTLPYIGNEVRVTLGYQPEEKETSCGFLVGGASVDMGVTQYGVDFSYNSFSNKQTDDFGVINITKRSVQDLVDFETTIDSQLLSTQKRKVKKVYDDILAFVIDPDSDDYENLVTLGTVANFSTVLSNPVSTVMSWSIQETI